MNTFDVNFYCRESKKNKKGLSHIELSVSINGTRNFINLPMQVPPEDFNRKTQPKYIREYTSLMRSTINNIQVELLRHSLPLTFDNIKDYIRTGGIKQYTVRDMVNDYLTLTEKRIGVDISKEQYNKYILTGETLYNYVSPESTLSSITPILIQNMYADWKKKYKEGTAAGYITRLKAIVRLAQDNDKISVNPFQGVKITKGKNDIEMITVEDVERIRNKTFVPRIERVKELFLFSCGSGLAFSDVMTLTPEDFKEENGQLYIIKNRNKTSVQYCSVLLPWAEEIARKYNFDMSGLKISNQKYNAYLKEIQAICLITSVKGLHSHVARHLYANHLLNHLGVRIETVARALGHSTTKTTLKYYARVSDATTLKEISEKISR